MRKDENNSIFLVHKKYGDLTAVLQYMQVKFELFEESLLNGIG